MSNGGVPEWFGKNDPPPRSPRRGGSRSSAPIIIVLLVVIAGGAGAWSLMNDRARDAARAQAAARAEAEASAQREERERQAREAEVLAAEKLAQAEAADDSPAPSEPATEDDSDLVAEISKDVDADEASAAGDAALSKRRVQDVRRVLASVEADARRCYAVELEQNPSAAGRVVATLVIEPSGRVSSAQTAQSGTLSAQVARCVAQVLRATRFEPASDSTTVNMPYVFES